MRTDYDYLPLVLGALAACLFLGCVVSSTPDRGRTDSGSDWDGGGVDGGLSNDGGVVTDAGSLADSGFSPFVPWSWSPVDAGFVVSMVRLDGRYPWTWPNALAQLQQRPAAGRVLYLHALHCVEVAGNSCQDSLIIRSEPSGTIRDGGFPELVQARLDTIFTFLADAGIRPEHLVLDYEESLDLWREAPHEPGPTWVAYVQSVWGDPVALSLLPEPLLAFPPSVYRSWQGDGFAAIMAWGDFSMRFRSQVLARAVLGPMDRAYSPRIPVTNFGDFDVGAATVPSNGLMYDWTGSTLLDDSAAPITYLLGGNRFQGLTKATRWNNLIYAVNFVRANVNVLGPDRVHPWISAPSYAGDNQALADPWAWRELVRHLRALGIAHPLWFNPHSTPMTAQEFVDDAVALAAFESAGRDIIPTPPPDGGWPLLPFDSDRFATGSVVSDYSNFVP